MSNVVVYEVRCSYTSKEIYAIPITLEASAKSPVIPIIEKKDKK